MSEIEPRPGGRPVGIADGVSAFGGGISYIIGTPRIWMQAAVPFVVLLVLVAVLSGLGLWGGWELSGRIVGEDPQGWGTAGRWVLTVLFGLVVLLLASLAAIALAQPLSGFALDKISLAQDFELTGRRRAEPGFFRSAFLGARIGSATLLSGGLVMGGLFVVGLIFPPALIVTLPVKLLVGAMLLAWDFIDYPLGLRGYDMGQRLVWVRENFPAFFAFGFLWALVLMIPCVALFVLPMGVAGATRLVVATEDAVAQP